MKTKLKPYDPAEFLTDEDTVSAYLTEARSETLYYPSGENKGIFGTTKAVP